MCRHIHVIFILYTCTHTYEVYIYIYHIHDIYIYIHVPCIYLYMYTWRYVQIASFGHICLLQVPTFAAWMLRVDVLGNAMADVIYILVAMVINPTVQDPD